MASGGRPPVRFLAIDTHWSSARGGVSTFNRELCLALARAGADVCCLVLEARPEEVSAAGDRGVRLIGAGLRPGWEEGELLMLRPRLPAGWQPQVIIGHGRVAGRFAEAHREDRFGGAAYFHFVHTDPERMGGDRAETKWEEELPLMAGADRVLAVGPALWRRAESDMRPLPVASVPIRIDPGFDLVGKPAKCPPPGGARKILVAGRLEDYDIKGLDVAARAVAGAINLCAGSTRDVALLLRGVPQEERAETEAKVLQWAGTDLDIDLHRYSDKSLDMQQDLGRSVLVLLPSRAEGFGLVGQEAIVAGVPVLVSRRSGLGELLSDEAANLAGDLVLPVNRDGQDVQPWSEAIAAVLDRPGHAFDRAAKLREWMSRKRSWAEEQTKRSIWAPRLGPWSRRSIDLGPITCIGDLLGIGGSGAGGGCSLGARPEIRLRAHESSHSRRGRLPSRGDRTSITHPPPTRPAYPCARPPAPPTAASSSLDLWPGASLSTSSGPTTTTSSARPSD